MSELDIKIKELEEEVAIDDSPQNKQKLMTLKAKYEELSLVKAEAQPFMINVRNPVNYWLYKLSNLNLREPSTQLEMNKEYYQQIQQKLISPMYHIIKHLYSSDIQPNLVSQNSFLDGLIISCITEAKKHYLVT